MSKRKHEEEDNSSPSIPLKKTKLSVPKIDIDHTYIFTTDEIERCFDIAQQRNDANIREKKMNRNFSGRDDLEISRQGVFAELAFRRMFNLPCFDLNDTTCRNVSNDTFDACIEGKTVDVKAVIRPNLPIIVSVWKKRNPPYAYCQLYLQNTPLTRPSGTSSTSGTSTSISTSTDEITPVFSAVFKGFVTAKQILHDSCLKELFRSKTLFYVMEQSKLRVWEDLEQTEKEKKLNHLEENQPQKVEVTSQDSNESITLF